MNQVDLISPQQAKTLAGLFAERVARTPEQLAYRYYREATKNWESCNWAEGSERASLWQQAMQADGLQPGDRVAVMLKNCLEWVLFDLAAAGLGLVTVPLYVNDRPENFTYILQSTQAKLLLTDGVEQWQRIEKVGDKLDGVKRIVTLQTVCVGECDPRLRQLDDWLPKKDNQQYQLLASEADSLATIVFTSGTTGPPKGVMLSHSNILSNAAAGLKRVVVEREDQFLSFLPLSHMFERTAGYYIPIMAGACVAFVRSIDLLAEDLLEIRPTILITVPRIFERIYNKMTLKLADESWLARKIFQLAVFSGWYHFQYHRRQKPWAIQLLIWPLLKRLVGKKLEKRLGGRLRLAVSGGAPLSPPIAQTFIGLGLTILQGYGLTETSPVIAVNTIEDNHPLSVGKPLPGVVVKIGEEQELLVRGPNVMLGYWQREDSIVDANGWLHTGDQAHIDKQGHIHIIGRIKEIIVLSSGEKVPPEDLQLAIATDPLFEQVLVVGENRPYLTAVVVLNPSQWRLLARGLAFDPTVKMLMNSPQVTKILLEKIAYRLKEFPGYARIHQVYATDKAWDIDSGLITATLKVRRQPILDQYADQIEEMYRGH
ncbi:long-chain fatty acid--CoA ligase [Malonomonas rubra]|uniref:AMP-dependent synthetase/ligase n=1 Tax=Malonomonas rubra TaxID=57040 RepID=UPI0026F265EA|nr:long-chain fatty acid--CoA ligase [Malonomonas rubra]